MADIAKKSTGVRPLGLPGDYEQVESKLAETLAAGDLVRLDTSTGYFTGANGTSASEANWVGILLTGGIAGDYATAIEKGEVEGFVLDALAFGAPVYASNTDKALADAAGTSSAIVGRVYPGRADGPTFSKLLKVGV
jgi:hypothetical protein